MHKSIATIDSPEFINLQQLDINPLMSSCEIKVFYLGENRNGTSISKEVAKKMAKTLRGAPIVGYYKKDKEDFTDHGDKVVIDEDGIHFECMTVPYGFVAPDAKVWFQKFEEEDDFGNKIIREYLMTIGYLWTGQYKECEAALEGEGRPHSMELDKDTIQGNWSRDYNRNMDFFIINDAIFSKLCVLGETTEPCFEGSSIKAPEVSLAFTKVDENFTKTLYTMMQDLCFALEGGQGMDKIKNVDPIIDENSAEKDKVDLENTVENQNDTEGETSIISDVEVPEVTVETPAETVETPAETVEGDAVAATDFTNKKDEDEKAEKEAETETDSKEEDDKSDEDEKEEAKKKYELLEAQYNELNQKYTAMQEEYQALLSFKTTVEDKEKDALIGRFYMLDDEDKKDVIDNKTNYSLNEIESKLSIIYTKKQLALENEQKDNANNSAEGIYTYNLAGNDANLPDWVKAVREVEENSKF